jgi:methionyl-tRNA formyltransferase
LRIAYAGTPEFALPALDALAASGHNLVGVLTQPDRPAGRGRALRASPVKLRALELGIPVAQPQRLSLEPELAALRSWQPELLVVVAYGLLLPPAVLGLPRLGCLNIHASLLPRRGARTPPPPLPPRGRGAAPVQRAIIAGDRVTGVTIMRLDAGLDTGPILAQRSVDIAATDTSAGLLQRLAPVGAGLLLEVIAALDAGTAVERAQPADGVTHAAKLGKSEARVDWTASAEHIARLVCACNPWPVAETTLHGEQLRIWEAAALPANTTVELAAANPEPGTVLGMSSKRLLVACGAGVLAVAQLQCAGKRVVSAADFAHAHATNALKFR